MRRASITREDVHAVVDRPVASRGCIALAGLHCLGGASLPWRGFIAFAAFSPIISPQISCPPSLSASSFRTCQYVDGDHLPNARNEEQSVYWSAFIAFPTNCLVSSRKSRHFHSVCVDTLDKTRGVTYIALETSHRTGFHRASKLFPTSTFLHVVHPHDDTTTRRYDDTTTQSPPWTFKTNRHIGSCRRRTLNIC